MMQKSNDVPACATPTHGSERCGAVSVEDTELVERVLWTRQTGNRKELEMITKTKEEIWIGPIPTPIKEVKEISGAFDLNTYVGGKREESSTPTPAGKVVVREGEQGERGEQGNVGPRGPAGDISQAMHNAERVAREVVNEWLKEFSLHSKS
jgi:hypothetical protein